MPLNSEHVLKGVACPVCSGQVDCHLYGENILGTEGSIVLDDGTKITACADVDYLKCENGHRIAVPPDMEVN